jgi:hypothetical protein
MSLSRDLLRAEAKKLYKEQAKSVPKKQRMTFAQFFENYKKTKTHKPIEVSPAPLEDFDLEQVVNINEQKTNE